MSQGLPGMARYKTVPVAFASHDPSRFPYGAPWLTALNSGDARGDLYTQIARVVQRPNAALARLPPNVRRRAFEPAEVHRRVQALTRARLDYDTLLISWNPGGFTYAPERGENSS